MSPNPKVPSSTPGLLQPPPQLPSPVTPASQALPVSLHLLTTHLLPDTWRLVAAGATQLKLLFSRTVQSLLRGPVVYKTLCFHRREHKVPSWSGKLGGPASHCDPVKYCDPHVTELGVRQLQETKAVLLSQTPASGQLHVRIPASWLGKLLHSSPALSSPREPVAKSC